MRSWNKFSPGLEAPPRWVMTRTKDTNLLYVWDTELKPRPRGPGEVRGDPATELTTPNVRQAEHLGVRSPPSVRRAPDNQNLFEFEIGSEVSYLEEPANHADWNSSSLLITSNSQARWGKPLIREGFTKKTCSSFGFFPNKGGPCTIFLSPFISAFLVNERSLFPPKCQ